jgi:hypothetical protein
MMKKRIYVVTISARKIGTTSAGPIFVVCESEEEAIGKGMKCAKRTWPESNGWSQYISEAMEIPEQVVHWVREYYKPE